MNEIVAIVGSRKWPEEMAVRDYVYSLDMSDTVISGECPQGVDAWAKQYALERGLHYKGYPPHFELWGQRAFAKRNMQIAKACTRLVAFHYKGSPGTSMTIGFAREHDKPVLEFHQPDAVD